MGKINIKMKLFPALFLAVAFAQEGEDERKVPPRTPEARMEQLKRHIVRLMNDHFSECNKSEMWEEKMTKLCNRGLRAYKDRKRECGFFDPDKEHGGPRSDDDERYSDEDAQSSVNGITAGIKKWSQRYLAECGGQKEDQNIARHAMKWRRKLSNKIGTC